MADILIEVPPISDQDSFIIMERRKSAFTFPIHIHRQFELNYIENARHARRIVGDHVSEIDDLELVLITGSNLEHAWVNHECRSNAILEITVQFNPNFFTGGMFDKKIFGQINRMLTEAQNGLAFSRQKILAVQPMLRHLPKIKDGFEVTLTLLRLMDLLSKDQEATILSHEMFSARPIVSYVSRRIKTVMDYLAEHYREQVVLRDVAAMINMSETSFCRFLKQHMGKSFVTYLNEVRISAVSRLLIDEPTNSIADIAYRCGFNNIANFNRIFKRLQGMTPQTFRKCYTKRRIIV